MKPILLFLLTCAMWGQGKPQKFYITGLAHSPTANDCTIPPIVAYGKDRVDALLHCCEGGGLTVWSEVEYQKMRQDIGQEFDESCKAAPKPAVSSDKPLGNNADGTVYDVGASKWEEDELCSNPRKPVKCSEPFPAPKPSFTAEKAVKRDPPTKLGAETCLNMSTGKTVWCEGEKYECPKLPGYRSFLLPDESTGEKVCLNVLKEKP